MTELRNLNDIYPLPPGTTFKVYESDPENFFVNDEGVIQTKAGDAYAAESMMHYTPTLPEDPPARRRETFDEFRQRLCVFARGFQQDHSVSAGPVHHLLRDLDCWFEGVAGPGEWVYKSDLDFTPPDDLVLTVGTRRFWNTYGVFTPGWTPMFGGLRSTRFARVEGPYPEATERDAELIRDLKVRIWDAGVRAKANERWCGAFERAVGAMRIDANVKRVTVTAPTRETPVFDAEVAEPDGGVPGFDYSPGDHVPTGLQSAFPVGTIFRWGTVGDDRREAWNWVVRRDPADANPARTTYLLGPNHGNYSSRGSDLVYVGGTPMWLHVITGPAGIALLDALPVGTHVGTGQDRDTCIGGSGHLYKQADGGWHSTTGYSTLSAEYILRNWPIHIMEMPGVPGAEPTGGPAAADDLDDLYDLF